jgi:hypothetical protein
MNPSSTPRVLPGIHHLLEYRQLLDKFGLVEEQHRLVVLQRVVL